MIRLSYIKSSKSDIGMFKILPLEEIRHFSKNVPIKSHLFLTSDHHFTIKLICFAFNGVETNFVSHRHLSKPKSAIRKKVAINGEDLIFLTPDLHFTIKLICFAFNGVETNFVSRRRLSKPKSAILPKSSHK